MSDINYKKRFTWYLFFTIFTLIFGIVYEQFSHGVYSNYMMFAFAVPLLGFAISFLLKMRHHQISRITLDLLDASVMTYTFGSIVKGVLEIYGTSNDYADWYFYVGALLAVLFVISLVIKRSENEK